MPDHDDAPAAPRGPLDRLLSLFGDVRGGEGLGAALLALNAFVLLFAYYLLKPVREALIVGGVGPEIKAYTAALQALLLLFLIPAYGRFSSRVSRIRLITWVTLFFVSNLAVFYVLGRSKALDLGIPFYVWVGIFNVMLVAQFWAFVNDVYVPEQGRRLIALIAIGSSTGGIFGSWTAKLLIKAIGVYSPMLIAGAMLLVCIAISRLVHTRSGAAHGLRGQAVDRETPLGRDGGFQLIWKQRYLLLIALLILMLNAVNTTGEYILGKAVRTAADQALLPGTVADPDAFRKQFVGLFYADFQFWVNLCSALAQLLLVSRIMTWFGVRAALFVLPLIALGGYGLIATAPLLGLIGVIKGVKIAENSTDYSLNNTARHALFLPTSREAKYKAKAAIDSFFWRMGDLTSAGLVFVGSRLHLDARGFAGVNFAFTLVWLWIVIRVAREHRKLAGESSTAPAAEASAPA